MADELLYASDDAYKISVKLVDRDDTNTPTYIRVAIGPSPFYYFDSVDLRGVIDFLDWFEIMVSIDTRVPTQQLLINGVDRLDALSGNKPQNFDIPHNDTVNAAIGGRTDTAFTSQWGGAAQEIWIADNAVDFVFNEDEFTQNGAPIALGVNGEAANITPYIYIRGKFGVDFANNFGGATGGFLETGTLIEDPEFPLRPGGTPPAGSEPDDTFEYVEALLGIAVTVPPSNVPTQQVFNEPGSGQQYIAIGADILFQSIVTPRNIHPLSFLATAPASQWGMSGGVLKSLDDEYAAADALGGNIALRCESSMPVFDGTRTHNAQDAFRFNGYSGSDPANEEETSNTENPDDNIDETISTIYSANIVNSWSSYNRNLAVINNDYFNLRIEDTLFDGIYSFMSCTNAGATLNQNVRRVLIENCLIWLRRLPYPLGHSNATLVTNPDDSSPEAFGHGFLFNYDSTLGPTLKIKNSIFYIEDYAANSGGYQTWDTDAATTIGIPDALSEAEGNTIIFGHPTDSYNPAWIPTAHQAAFTILNYADDTSNPDQFFQARNDWITDHPNVGRVGDALFDGPITWNPAQTWVPYPPQ